MKKVALIAAAAASFAFADTNSTTTTSTTTSGGSTTSTTSSTSGGSSSTTTSGGASTTSTTTSGGSTSTASSGAAVTSTSNTPPAPPFDSNTSSSSVAQPATQIIFHSTMLNKGWNMFSLMGFKPVNLPTLFRSSSSSAIQSIWYFDNTLNDYKLYRPNFKAADYNASKVVPIYNVRPDMGMWINVTDPKGIVLQYRYNTTNADDFQIRLKINSTGATVTPPPPPPVNKIVGASGNIDETTATNSTATSN